MRTRELAWEALRNARDLGGLPVAGGGETRFGAVVRSDTLRQLTSSGWRALDDYGIRTVVDLRFQVEIDANEPLDAGPGGLSRPLAGAASDANGRPRGLITRPVSLLGEPDRALGEHFDRISRAQPLSSGSTRAVYLEMLRLFRERFAVVVATIADAPAGGILVHCHAGKDRTGLVVALLLSVAGVDAEAIAADYASSGPNLAPSLAGWIAEADDTADREHRRRVAESPAAAMLDVLAELESRHGGAEAYLLRAGATAADVARIRTLLVG